MSYYGAPGACQQAPGGRLRRRGSRHRPAPARVDPVDQMKEQRQRGPKVMYMGGVTRAWGAGRRRKSRRDRRCSSKTATSPSKISAEVGTEAIAAASARNRPVQSRPCRLRSRTVAPCLYARTRQPSYFSTVPREARRAPRRPEPRGPDQTFGQVTPGNARLRWWRRSSAAKRLT